MVTLNNGSVRQFVQEATCSGFREKAKVFLSEESNE